MLKFTFIRPTLLVFRRRTRYTGHVTLVKHPAGVIDITQLLSSCIHGPIKGRLDDDLRMKPPTSMKEIYIFINL